MSEQDNVINAIKRVRTLTMQGMEAYEENVQYYYKLLTRSWEIVENYINKEGDEDRELLKIEVLRQFSEVDNIFAKFNTYLIETRTKESEHEAQRLANLMKKYRKTTSEFKQKLKAETSEEQSTNSRISNRSSILLQKQADVQAAKARAVFAEQEAVIKRQQVALEEQQKVTAAATSRQNANLEIELSLIRDRKQVAIAEAEIEAFEQSQAGSINGSIDLPQVSPEIRTAQYVAEAKVLDPDAASFKPKDLNQPNNQKHLPHDQVAGDLTKYLLKKDLLLSRLTNFNDKPENYVVWKSSFNNLMDELGRSCNEELDFLIKYLGPESVKYAISIRSANITHPEIGLRRIWERLDDRYGCPEMVEECVRNKLKSFPSLTYKDTHKLYDLSDIVSEIESLQEDPKYSVPLSFYQSSSGVGSIVNKLPFNLREKWVTHASNYKRKYNVTFPPFSVFASFLRDLARTRNDPSLMFGSHDGTTNVWKTPTKPSGRKPEVTTSKTGVDGQTVQSSDKRCPIHKTNHDIHDCRAFKEMNIANRRKLLKDNNLCFKCMSSSDHRSKDCEREIKCLICASTRHSTLLHDENFKQYHPPTQGDSHGGEKQHVSSKCTEICGRTFSGKSCAKISLVKIYPTDHPENATLAYAIIDDQSNRSLGKSALFDILNFTSTDTEYTLSTCGGHNVTQGRVTNLCTVESLDGENKFQLDSLLECDQIPSIRQEIPTPEVTLHRHLKGLIDKIPPIRDDVDILILIGRDCIEAHHVLDQKIGPRGSPYAQRLPLGWVVIGETCFGSHHKSNHVNVNKTYLLNNGRHSLFKPCESEMTVQNNIIDKDLNDKVFERKKNDDEPSYSVEDREFLKLMNSEMQKAKCGNWTAPLPFRSPKPTVTSNRANAERRAKSLDSSLHRDPKKKRHFVEFMAKMLENGHAEVALPLLNTDESWYLPVFGVYHPQKPDQIRCVFDSSAKYQNVSLNDILLQGPDLTNSLIRILIRFRREQVAVTVDIQQMFYCFLVNEEHRNYLRFFWHKDNDTSLELIEYRMRVHVFGNSPSPAIATFGLRKSVEEADADVQQFINRNFYVDDGLTSHDTATDAVSLVKRTQKALKVGGNLLLHKISSNNKDVMKAFETKELAGDLKNVDLTSEDLPVQGSLGLKWDLNDDRFIFKVAKKERPLTRRGILSSINSLFDPLGFLAPVIIDGKLILRDLIGRNNDWDSPIPSDVQTSWVQWQGSFQHIEHIFIPRTYFSQSVSKANDVELHVFSDASERAISAVAYLCSTSTDGTISTGFVMGKSKVAPASGHTIPRLELCAAVLGVQTARVILDNIDMKLSAMKYYTDSKVVLGYINNTQRRFYNYVANRVEKIRKQSDPDQWNYVPTEVNPADLGSRGIKAIDLQNSSWIVGPEFLRRKPENQDTNFALINPDLDVEIRKDVKVLKTNLHDRALGTKRFSKFSSLSTLIKTIARLKHIAKSFRSITACKGWHICGIMKTVESLRDAKNLIYKEVQLETYPREVTSLSQGKPLPRDSTILSLDPFIGDDGLLRVGGRLTRATMKSQEKHPIILPNKHHVSTLIVRHHHKLVKHQGRHFTEGALRSNGYWIVGAKRLVSSIIHCCVKCKRLRGKHAVQLMADLPKDRIEPAPPFTFVGVDVFGPWSIVTRRTRGGQANS